MKLGARPPSRGQAADNSVPKEALASAASSALVDPVVAQHIDAERFLVVRTADGKRYRVATEEAMEDAVAEALRGLSPTGRGDDA